MKLDEIPFLHYFCFEEKLITIKESKNNSQNGNFYVPILENGHFYPFYRFHFKIYLGKGEFFKDKNNNNLFNGIGILTNLDHKKKLLLTFEFPEGYSPKIFSDDNILIPMLERIPKLSSINYEGELKHKDFHHSFFAMQESNENTIDELFDKFKISIIGCDQSLYV